MKALISAFEINFWRYNNITFSPEHLFYYFYRIEKPINWQLPHVKKSIKTEIRIVPEIIEPKTKIKEKRISSLGDIADDVPSVFKKRKPNPNRGNIRQRIEED